MQNAGAYRRDIDGLRAIAVLSVVFYHAGVSGIEGGFVGVDVFFVISGYLITGLLCGDIEKGYSVRAFYERRVRRILPALFTVLIVTCVASYFIMFPIGFDTLGQSMAASALFASNVFFAFKGSGYFDASALSKPLLHTWSLSVEEQFYVFYPIFLIAVLRLRWSLTALLLVCCAISLVAVVWATATYPRAAFYLAPFRAWELGLGGLLAIGAVPQLRSRSLREACALAGFILIVAPIFIYDNQTPFPGFSVIPPCIGTACVLYAGRETITGRLLSQSPLVFIGLISYSLYLWHWPVIALYRYATQRYLSVVEISGLLSVSFVLAVLSWRFIEQPFRRRRQGRWLIGSRVTLAAAASVTVLLAGLGAAVHFNDGAWWRLTPQAQLFARAALDVVDKECMVDETSDWNPAAKPCIRGKRGPVHTALWGDSHALALLPGVIRAADRVGQRIVFFGVAGCPPTPEINRIDGWHNSGCAQYNAWALQHILGDPQISNVILAARLAAYVEDSGFGPAEQDQPAPDFIYAGRPDAAPSKLPDLILEAFGETVAKLRADGKRVAIVYPIPELGRVAPRALGEIALRGGDPNSFFLAKSVFEARTHRTQAYLDSISSGADLVRIRPSSVLCRINRCTAIMGGAPLYRDDDHLSIAGAIFLSPLFAAVFNRAGS